MGSVSSLLNNCSCQATTPQDRQTQGLYLFTSFPIIGGNVSPNGNHLDVSRQPQRDHLVMKWWSSHAAQTVLGRTPSRETASGSGSSSNSRKKQHVRSMCHQQRVTNKRQVPLWFRPCYCPGTHKTLCILGGSPDTIYKLAYYACHGPLTGNELSHYVL